MYDEELSKKKFSLKAMYYNRFLSIRYLLATLFFTNLYWLVLLGYYGNNVLIPIGMIVFLCIAIIENIRVYNDNKATMKFTKVSLYLQIITNIALIGLTYTTKFSYFFFFMTQNQTTKLFVITVLLVGCFLCILAIKKISLINSNTDKQYRRILEYKKATGL